MCLASQESAVWAQTSWAFLEVTRVLFSLTGYVCPDDSHGSPDIPQRRDFSRPPSRESSSGFKHRPGIRFQVWDELSTLLYNTGIIPVP